LGARPGDPAQRRYGLSCIGLVLLREPITVPVGAGMLCILLGLAILTLRPRQQT
jgi:drug/metabolite transporter (DMT)-like permease